MARRPRSKAAGCVAFCLVVVGLLTIVGWLFDRIDASTEAEREAQFRPGAIAEVVRYVVVGEGLMMLDRAKELDLANDHAGFDELRDLGLVGHAAPGDRCRIITCSGAHCEVRFETGLLTGKAFHIDRDALREPR